jgi:signal transduction histidine kinase
MSRHLICRLARSQPTSFSHFNMDKTYVVPFTRHCIIWSLKVRISMASHMKQQRTLQEIHASICDYIKGMYAANGSLLSEEEVTEAANNLIRFCERVVELNSRRLNK